MKNQRHLNVLVAGFVVLLIWGCGQTRDHSQASHDDAQTVDNLGAFSVAPPTRSAPLPYLTAKQIPALSASDKSLVSLGRSFFEDTSFSRKHDTACATCHDPKLYFTDGKIKGGRNTPAIFNTALMIHFFWDGRASSLEFQAMGPIENPDEHDFNRGRVAQVIYQKYLVAYEKQFGAFPAKLGNRLKAQTEVFEASPAKAKVVITDDYAIFARATILSDSVRQRVDASIQQGFSTAEAVSMETASYDLRQRGVPQQWVDNYRNLGYFEKNQIDQVYYNFAHAIASFERTILSADSPYDQFTARRQASNVAVEKSFNASFGAQEWAGLNIFFTKSNCDQCHSGPNFSDQKFHNIGIPQNGEMLDLGRAMGRIDSFFCPFESIELKDKCPTQLTVGNEDGSRYEVGAFRTPSLRNVAKTGPYMHNGSFVTLRDVIIHYSDLTDKPAVGRLAPELKPSHLTAQEIQELEAFLISLTAAPVFMK